MKLWQYLLRRLLFVVPQLLGITFITFLLIKLIPGDPARLMLGHRSLDVTEVYAEADHQKVQDVVRKIG